MRQMKDRGKLGKSFAKDFAHQQSKRIGNMYARLSSCKPGTTEFRSSILFGVLPDYRIQGVAKQFVK